MAVPPRAMAPSFSKYSSSFKPMEVGAKIILFFNVTLPMVKGLFMVSYMVRFPPYGLPGYQ